MSMRDTKPFGRRPWVRVLALAFSSLCGSSTIGASIAGAQVTHDFRILPDPAQTLSKNRAYFVYELAPGAVLEDAVLVKNMGGADLRLVLFPGDTVTGSRGGISIATLKDQNPSQTGAWLRLSETELQLGVGENRSVPFTLEVPVATPPGEYAAVVVVQRAEDDGDPSQKGALGIQFIPRAAVTVLLTVPGPEPLEPELEISGLEPATRARQQTVVASLRNTGNQGVQSAEGRLSVRQTDGTLSQETPVRLGYVLAGGNLRYGIGLVPELAAGPYDVTLRLTYSEGTIERTERLLLGTPTALPIVSKPESPVVVDRPSELPEWVVRTLLAAGAIILLMAVLLSMLYIRLHKTRGKGAR